MITATIRWIDESNAHSLGYFGYGKNGTGTWVLEGDGDVWITDLGDLDDIATVQRKAETRLSLTGGQWRSLPSNYGPAMTLIAHG